MNKENKCFTYRSNISNNSILSNSKDLKIDDCFYVTKLEKFNSKYKIRKQIILRKHFSYKFDDINK